MESVRTVGKASRRVRKPVRVAVAGIIAVLAFSSNCALAQSAATLTPLNVGTMKTSSQTPDYYAKKYGIFARNGLSVTLTEFTNGGNAIAAGQSGAVDIMVAIPGIAMLAMQNGFDLQALFQIEVAKNVPPDTGSLQVLATSNIKNLTDLSGKTIAVAALGSQNTISVQTVLKRAGVDLKTVKFIELPFPAMINAVKAEQVDAVSLIDPFTTQMLSTGVGRVLAWSYVDALPGQPTSVWWAKSAFVKEHPDVVERFNKSIKEAMDELNADPEKARVEVSAYTGLNPDLVKSMPAPSWDYRVRPTIWEGVVQMMAESGFLKNPRKVEDYMSPQMKEYLVKD